MMRADAFSLHVEHIRTKITGIQQIPILHVCDLDDRKPKGIITDKQLLQLCSFVSSPDEKNYLVAITITR